MGTSAADSAACKCLNGLEQASGASGMMHAVLGESEDEDYAQRSLHDSAACTALDTHAAKGTQGSGLLSTRLKQTSAKDCRDAQLLAKEIACDAKAA